MDITPRDKGNASDIISKEHERGRMMQNTLAGDHVFCSKSEKNELNTSERDYAITMAPREGLIILPESFGDGIQAK